MKRLALAIFLACASLGAAASEQPAAASASVAAFDLAGEAARALKLFDVPGMAIAVVKDGKLIESRGFGVRKRGEAAAVDGDTLFEVASNSKAFTAVALAMLVDEGKLGWDDPVVKPLPDFQMWDAYVTREMTVRDLLVHRSGLGLGAGDLLWWPSTQFSSEEIIQRLRHVKPATSFRSMYAYDNLLYIVAGKIIASKYGKSWGEVMRERILQPLGMQNSTVSVAEMLKRPNVSAPHSKINGVNVPVKPMPVPNADGAVGINTSANDVARWMRLLLDEGQLDGAKRLYSARQARELMTLVTPMRFSDPPPALAATRPNFLGYGLGFQLRDYKGKKVAYHGGALQGFYTRLVLVPEARLGIAILTNAENGPVLNAMQYRLLDAYLGGAQTDWIGVIAKQAEESAAKEQKRLAEAGAKAKAAASRPSLALKAYAGEYDDVWYGKVRIADEAGKLVMRFSRTPDLVGTLEHYQYDTFIVRWNERNFNADAYVSFALNPDGSIERIRMKAVSEETDFSYDFHDLDLRPVKQ